jgi:hypothetical protein
VRKEAVGKSSPILMGEENDGPVEVLGQTTEASVPRSVQTAGDESMGFFNVIEQCAVTISEFSRPESAPSRPNKSWNPSLTLMFNFRARENMTTVFLSR